MPPSRELRGLALQTDEYPEVVMSLPSSPLWQRRGLGAGAGGAWVPGVWWLLSSGQASSSLDSWQQCCSGFRKTTVTSRSPLGDVTEKSGDGGGCVYGTAQVIRSDPTPAQDGVAPVLLR